jgi:ATP:ADP antiporter, AAA family
MSTGSKVYRMFKQLFEVEPHERTKLFFLTAAFFFVIGGYTVAKELKDALFMHIVGKEYIPIARTMVMFALMPAIFCYSKLVDRMRRYQLLNFFSIFFALGGLVFAYLIGHPTIGLANTDIGPHRWFGWIFYLFVEGYSPFLVSVFWAFANSITGPDEAKRNYGLMVAGSKMGGALSALFAYSLFTWGMSAVAYDRATDIYMHQVVYFASVLMLLMVPIMIWLLMKKVPAKYMHGYEAAYRVEKKRDKEKASMFDGLRLLIEYPYVLGIFGMVYFYEVIGTVLSYLRLGVAQSSSDTMSGMSGYLCLLMFQAHLIGFIISLFGTRELLRRLGTRICLMLTPLSCGALLVYILFDGSPHIFSYAYAFLKSLNLAFSWPVRESLYIPTVKDIKFKSKSWIDAFGSKFAKTSGSVFNWFTTQLGAAALMPLHAFFFAGIISVWFVTALLLGRRFERAIANNEVIGLESNEQ